MAFYGWTNSKFQTVHFLIGACHTPIDAHRVVMQQLMDKESALESNSGVEGFYIDQARDELAFLIDCKARLEAHIGFVPTSEDYQQNSAEEWKLELMTRAENFLLSGSGIPPQEIAVMRMHPAWSEISTHIKTTGAALLSGADLPALKPSVTTALLGVTP